MVRYGYSDASKKLIISQVINNSPQKIIFNEKQIDQLYHLSLKSLNHPMSKEDIITELRGGDIEDVASALAFIITIITLINNVEAFQVPANQGEMVPPHLQWLYGNKKSLNKFGYPSKSASQSLKAHDVTTKEIVTEAIQGYAED